MSTTAAVAIIYSSTSLFQHEKPHWEYSFIVTLLYKTNGLPRRPYHGKTGFNLINPLVPLKMYHCTNFAGKKLFCFSNKTAPKFSSIHIH